MNCSSFIEPGLKTHLRRLFKGWMTLAFLVMFLTAQISQAQDVGSDSGTSTASPSDASEIFLAPVVIDGNVLFQVRGFTALPALERAEKVQSRLIAVAESSDFQKVRVDIDDNEFGLAILADGQIVTIATQADAEYEQVELNVLAGLQAEAIEAAILKYRKDRSEEARVDSAFAALGWTAIFALVTYFLVRKRRWLIDKAGQLIERQFERVEAATSSLVKGRAIAAMCQFVLNLSIWAIYLFIFYYYLSFVLLAFAETRPFAELLLTYVTDPLVSVVSGLVSYLPNLITLIIIAVITRWIIQGLRLFFDNLEKGAFASITFEKHWIAPTFFLCRIVVILIALVFAYPYIPGSDSAAFQGLTILAGVMLSLGSNTVISNMMSGLFVIYRRSTNVGDRIRVGDKIGDVVEIKLMETLMKSTKNELISIPNSQLLNSEVVNYSRKIDGRGLLVHTTVGIGYEEPPAKIKAMLIEAARRTPGLKKSPAPFVLWTQLGDYAISYEINGFTSRGASLPKIMSDLHENIVKIFNANRTQIMTPSYIADTEMPKVPSETWDGTLELPREDADEALQASEK